MHRIRLKEPWIASLNAEANVVIYSRKFHKPTGVEDQSITLVVHLLPQKDGSLGEALSAYVNGVKVEPNEASSENGLDHLHYFQLQSLALFNTLELRISRTFALTRPVVLESDVPVIPTFGSFVIESVELAIE